MTDVTKLSDEELLGALQGPAAQPDVKSMSDEELLSALHGSIPDITDPNSPDYSRRHGGSVVTAIIDGIKSAVTLPRDVYEGKVDPLSDEGIGRTLDMAAIANPAAPAGLIPTARVAPKVAGEVAAAAQELSATGGNIAVPRAVASDSRVAQALFQRGRQVPGATGVIDKSIDDFYTGVTTKADELAARAGGGVARTPEEVGGKIRRQLEDQVSATDARSAEEIARAQKTADDYVVNAEAGARRQVAGAESAAQSARKAFDDLAPDAPGGTRATVGDDLKSSIESRIQFHKAEQAKPYDVLRRTLIDADKPVGVTGELAGALNAIMRERIAAAEGAIPRDLVPVVDIATNPRGVTFNGLQRARSTLAERIDFEESQGFNAGDLKRAYGALTEAMKTVVEGSARNGASQAALRAFEKAEGNFGARAETVRELSAALRNGPENLVDRMIAYAGERSGANINKLRAMQKELPAEGSAKVSRLAFQRLAQDAKGEFSEATLVRNWAAISPEGRQILFGANASKIDQAIKSIGDTAHGLKFASEVADASIKAAQRDAKANVNAATVAATAKAREQNRELLALLSKSDEQVVNEALRWAADGAGADIQKLVRMSTLFGQENMAGLASIAIQRLGEGRGKDFTAAAFAKNWDGLTANGKTLLFRDPELRRALDNLAKVTDRMARTQKKFGNSSGTGGAVGLGALGAGLYADPFTTLAAVTGANVMARVLAKPAVAKAAARYATVAEVAAKSRSPAALAQLQRAKADLAMAAERAIPVAVNDNAARQAASGQ